VRVPPAAGWLARRTRELAEVATSRAARVGDVPPRRLRARTGAPGGRDWDHGGAVAAAELESALGRSFAGFEAILDLGCGSARVLPHVAALAPSTDCAGCDVDATAIAWAARHRAGPRFSVSDYQPPLPYRAGEFELIYSISVFSHLDEQLQDDWLAELARVLAPGGTALLSIHGAYAFEQFRTGRVHTAWCPPGVFDRPPLGAAEFAFVPYRRSLWNRGELPGIGGGYGLAFHGERYIEERWGRHLTVERIAPRALTGWQDVVVAGVPSGH
jgi:SAM-dependent methyltransferase